MTELVASEVRALFEHCRFKQDDPPNTRLEMPGVLPRPNFVLSRVRVEQNRQKIEGLLACLPVGFHQYRGGGLPMSRMGHDYSGYAWTRDEALMERLLILGLAIGGAKFLQPRAQWQDGRSPVVIVTVAL